MSKKTKKVEVEEPQVQEEVAVKTAPVVEQPKRKRTEPTYKKTEDGWEIRDRMYRLKGDKKPLSRMIRSASIYYFDEEKVMKENLSTVKIKKQYL